jgi:D-alanine-D-alanine ligase
MLMVQNDLEDPLSKPYTVGLIYNLKKATKTEINDDEVEYDSIDTVMAIKSALETNGHQVILLEADNTLLENLKKTPPDIAFNIAEGRNGRGREAQIPAILSFLGIPSTGSDETTLCLALDKALTKRLLSSYKIRTPKYAVFPANGPVPHLNLSYPVIIKPNAEGSSKGISDNCIARSYNELLDRLKSNFSSYSGTVLIEEYIEGREFTVGILGNGLKAKVFPPMEIIYKKTTQENYHVYNFNVKQNYKEYVEYQCPACLSQAQEAEMTDMSRKIYNILGCCDFSRIDFRMTNEGRIYFIEINPLPGLAPGYSDYPMIVENCGVKYTELINSILNAAIVRLKLRNRGEMVI